MAEEIFIQLGLILFTAFIVSYVIRTFNQPLIVGYIISGVIISPYIISFGISNEVISTFSKFGIAFLLFMVGMHLNPRVVKEIGVASLIIGLVQMLIIFAIGFGASVLLGFGDIESTIIGLAISFSSTIIIMKLLSDKKQLDSLDGKISIGILIIQDLVAIAVLMYISSFSFGEFGYNAIKGLLGGIILILFLLLAGVFVIPRLTRSVASSPELLFLFSITLAFGTAALFNYIGFSIEIGALIAGVVLAFSPYNTEITSKIRPLRDFFLIIFFIILGFNLNLPGVKFVIFNAVIFSLIVLILKPVTLMTLSAVLGYTKRTNFLVGITHGQVSEFSLILATLAASVGLISGEVLSTITLTAIITIAISTYMIIYSNELYKKSSGFVSIFEKKSIKKENKKKNIKYDAVLFGYNRIGFSILRSLKEIKKSYLVVDFNPDVVTKLSKVGIPCIYGDAYDADFLDELNLEKVKIVVSTIPDFDTSILLIESVRSANPNAIIIVRAHEIKHAFDFYKKGADYVLTPHFLGGEYVAKMIAHYSENRKEYDKEGEKHIKMLRAMEEKGSKHPDIEQG